MTAGEVASATGGQLVGDDVTIDGASTDSRSIEPGQLFVPIVGERVDGHDYIDPGMTLYLTARGAVGGNAIEVVDSGEALIALGRRARGRIPDRVVGITGSVGKTTVKDLLAAILRRRFETLASPGNFNSEIGLPLSLLNGPDDAEAAVLEMGARGIGHISLLCSIGRPTVGVVTAVAPVHTEVFGTVEDVARGKSELVAALPRSGTAILNGDDHRCAAMAAVTDARVLTYRVERDADLVATAVHFDDELRPSFVARTPWGDVELRVGVRGVHQVGNALAAAGAALAVGATLEDVAAGLATVELSHWRMDLQRSASGTRVINDAYNASPISMEAALRTLAALSASRHVAFLGTMAELEDADAAHAEVAGVAASLGVRVIAVDEPRYGAVDNVGSIEEAAALLDLGPDDAVLVKASRSVGLERLAAELLQR
jgi:UDP-N-acetylmuramoyl-tripeptide--D-alanyl-D-alanine ligase